MGYSEGQIFKLLQRKILFFPPQKNTMTIHKTLVLIAWKNVYSHRYIFTLAYAHLKKKKKTATQKSSTKQKKREKK